MPIADAVTALRRLCQERQLPVPSDSTLRRRLKGLDADARSVMPSQGATILRSSTAYSSGASGEADLLALLYDAVGKAEGWNTFIDALARSYQGGIGVLLVHDTGIRNGFAQAVGQVQPDQIAAYNSHYAAVNPWMSHLDKKPLGLVVPDEFLLSRSELHKTEFYADFLRPAGLGAGVGLTVQKDGSRHMLVSVLFPQATAERDADAIGRLQRLVPHLLRVAQLNRQLAGMEARVAAAETALDRLGTAMLVVDSGGRVVHMNAAALQGSWNVAAPPGGVMRISRRSGRTPYEILVSPVSNTTLSLGFNGPLAAIFVRDPEARSLSPLERLQCLYGLTAAEARLMQSVLAGDTLEAIAEREGVSKETRRSQLKAVFAKTGTASQSELLRLGLRGVAALRV